MNHSNTHQKLFSINSLIIILIVCLSLTIFASFSSKPELPFGKIKFTSMVMKKTELTEYSSYPKFSHFLFQTVNLDNTSGRNSFELVVYAYDSDGVQLNPNPRLLTSAKNQPNPAVNDRSDNIYFSNYVLSKSHYERMISGYSSFDSLKFIAESINGGYSYPNYITYKMVPVKGRASYKINAPCNVSRR